MFQLLLSKIKLKHGLGFLALLTSLIWLAVFSFPTQKLKIVFCNVGQGDAILIQKGTNQILIDGGPSNKVLDCLANNMPFWDRTIEIVALTHPQADHLTGIILVMERYKVDYFLAGPEGNESAGYKQLIEKIIKTQTSSDSPLASSNNPLTAFLASSNHPLTTPNSFLAKSQASTKGIKVINPYTGEIIKLAGMELETLWPEKNWVASKIINDQFSNSDNLTSSNHPLTSSISNFGGAVLGASTTQDLNNFSLVFLLKYGDVKALFPGDADSGIQDQILLNNSSLNSIDILKVPHHGAKTSLRDDFLEIIKPKEAIISVGKNSYGHPNGELIKKLENLGIKVRRTDLEGEIKISI